jgi:hypothetical protein
MDSLVNFGGEWRVGCWFFYQNLYRFSCITTSYPQFTDNEFFIRDVTLTSPLIFSMIYRADQDHVKFTVLTVLARGCVS